MRLFARALVALCLSASTLFAAEYDDCDANFIAFIGASAYQFSPGHEGELGAVRLFSILSYQRAAHERRFGTALWQLRIDRVADGTRVLTLDGRAHIGQDGAAVAELWWDGRDDRGALVPAGAYRYTFVARYGPGLRRAAFSYDEAFDADEALASSDEVIVNYELSHAAARNMRISTNATSCELQQNAPLEAGFPYHFYYGSTHAHSNWSDGGHPTSACSSGNAYGSGTFAPADVFNYARNTAGLDFWVVNEHNHLMQDAIATNSGPVTEAKVRQRYQDGRAAANAATVDGSFVAMYGMEWGVSTNADQGHITLIETPQLFGWETCTTCNGPNPECTPGTNCYFDVFTPKRYGYLALYAASVAHPSSAGALGIFNHPGAGNFDNFAFNADADAAMQGIAVRSGLAFSTASDCSTANVATSDYTQRWKEALVKGFHVGPVADHDSHCNNYGTALPTRTVYLAPSLTKANLLAAHRARHFFASEDPNAQLVFRTGDGAQVMGDIFNAAGGATLVANVYDPDGESTTTIEIWRGTIGGAVPAAPYASFTNQSSIAITEPLTSGSYWYYVRAVQADGHDLWSSPMWITYATGRGGGDTIAPAVSITTPAAGVTVAATIAVNAAASDNTGVTKVEFLLDGALQATDTSAPYEWSWNTTTATNGAHALVAKAYDAANNSALSASVNVTVSNGTTGGGSSASVGGWKVTQANSAYEYLLPSGTTIPADGYLVIARAADKAAFESFWGVTLPANALFLNSGGAMPVINGDEHYSLFNGTGALADGPSAQFSASAGTALQRVDPCGTSWNSAALTAANPGSGAGGGCGGGVKLNEIADATGTGNYIYEYVELHNDAAAASDTVAPVTAISAPVSGASLSGTVVVTATASDAVGVTGVEFLLDGSVVATDTASPYEWSWATLTAANGAHTLAAKAYDAANNVGTSSSVTVTVANDVTAPATSITAPANAATVSSIVSVTANATDNVGVTKVEFFLDGVLKSTDTASPYAWSWDTATAANGAHTLVSKAHDAAGNVGTSAGISVTVSNGVSINISGYTLVQSSAALTYAIPPATTIPSRGYVIVARGATKAQFESFWGVTLAPNVVYINAAEAMPQINGSETYALNNAAGTRLDGATVAMASAGGESLRRTNGCGTANKSTSWTRAASSTANPGSGAPAPCGKGVYISEFSDALGTGNYIYEFVELFNDK
ncbi:MAG TPA: Ig-like domain-containing protein [Thermoanaerobaculia bacterium]|nr:Ig-like domain-containing protein [Thermoanaerobaculia bacterium]